MVYYLFFQFSFPSTLTPILVQSFLSSTTVSPLVLFLLFVILTITMLITCPVNLDILVRFIPIFSYFFGTIRPLIFAHIFHLLLFGTNVYLTTSLSSFSSFSAPHLPSVIVSSAYRTAFLIVDLLSLIFARIDCSFCCYIFLITR